MLLCISYPPLWQYNKLFSSFLSCLPIARWTRLKCLLHQLLSQWWRNHKGDTLAKADNLSVASDQPTWPKSNSFHDLLRGLGHAEERKGESLRVSISLGLKPPYWIKVAAKSYPIMYTLPKFQKFDDFNDNTKEHIIRFLDFMSAHAHDTDILLKGIFKSLTDRTYIRVVVVMGRVESSSCKVVEKSYDEQVVFGRPVYGTGQKVISPNLINVSTCLQPV